MSERGAPTPTPTDHLKALLNQYARVNDPAERDEMIAVFQGMFVILPISEYVTEVNAMGEWQARARRVINAANAVFDHHDEPDRIDRLVAALIETDFRTDPLEDRHGD